jgi:anti-sigma factor RsiW
MADEWTAQLDTYLDGELTADEQKSLDAHLRACPACAADVLARLQLKRTTQSAGRRHTPDNDFRRRMQQKIAARPRRSTWPGLLTAAATVTLLLVVGLVFNYVRQRRIEQAQTFSELADLHVATLASPNPVDVVSTDRHTVKPWFAGKIPFTFNLPELQNTEFNLIGGRVSYLGQAPGAELIYQVRKHQISVFIFQEQALGRPLPADSGPQKQVSFNAESWSQDGLRYFALSDVGPEDVAKLVELFKQAARS